MLLLKSYDSCLGENMMLFILKLWYAHEIFIKHTENRLKEKSIILSLGRNDLIFWCDAFNLYI